LICELLYENDNTPLSRAACFDHITNKLKINIDSELFSQLLEKSKNFEVKSEAQDVYLNLTPEKYALINRNINEHSIENYINTFSDKHNLSEETKLGIERLLFQSIYENINSFTVSNIKTIIPEELRSKSNREQIEAFNAFLDEKNQQKDIALFNVFLKAVEFAIVTSGKGVKQFTEQIFKGKEYCLDTNIIFRILGVNGVERQVSIVKLIESCLHQGIKFSYSVETHKEVVRKIESSLLDIKKGAESKSIEILQDLISEDGLLFNNSFITHYAECKINNTVKSPEQYQVKLLSDLRHLGEKYNIETVASTFKPNHVELLQDFLYDKKKEHNASIRYSKTAAKVDAHNILLVRSIRKTNNYSYTDIKSFYLTTDRLLNSILAKENEELIAETILPSQLYILHNALYDEEDEEKDYQAFNKFLKRRTTEFKYEGKDVLNFIDEIRNITSDSYTIKDVIKTYADVKFKNGFDEVNHEPEVKSFKEYAETYFDEQFRIAKSGDKKYQQSLSNALNEIQIHYDNSKAITRYIDILITVIIIPLSVVLMKQFTKDTTYIIIGTLFFETIKFFVSNKTNLLKNICESIFKRKIKSSAFFKITNGADPDFNKRVKDFLEMDINIWKR
ncbi:MAG: hypothetical protein ABI367_09295, partial [Mucilaginibacter sp.]